MSKIFLRQVMSQTIAIDDDEWAALEPYIFTKNIKKKTVYLREGTVSTDIGFVVKGALRQYYIVDGEEKTTFFFFDNSFVCDYDSFLTQRPTDHYIEAIEDCEILYFSREVIYRLYRLYPKYETFGKLIAESVYLCIKERLTHFLLNTPEQRYRHFMQSTEADQILQRVPQHYVASYLGITPVSLSRIRARVAREDRSILVA
jgi:CRP-like cAMP-binding protein